MEDWITPVDRNCLPKIDSLPQVDESIIESMQQREKYIKRTLSEREVMKKYIYKLTLEDGNTFDYTIDNGIMFNHKSEDGVETVSLITSALFLEAVDVEDAPIVVEVENEPAE